MFRIEIVTRMDRQKALSFINDGLSASDGWIVHHQLFSNMAASLVFEMPYTSLETFVESLKEEGLNPRLTDELRKERNGDVRGSIAITFLHDEPDLKRDVPAFG